MKNRNKQDTTYQKTFKLLKSYRDAMKFMEIATAADQQDARERTRHKLDSINAAIGEIEKRKAQSGRTHEYAAFKMYFIDGCTYEQIAEELNASKNTPRRWVTTIINELGVLLWGYNE